MSDPKTSQSKLDSAKAWKVKHAEKNKAINDARNLAIRSDPEAWAKKLESNRQSAKRNRDKRRQYDQDRDPLKKWARTRLRHQVAKGKIKRLPCEKCGDPLSEGHHEDYSKALEVIWLCRPCHKKHHENESKDK